MVSGCRGKLVKVVTRRLALPARSLGDKSIEKAYTVTI